MDGSGQYTDAAAGEQTQPVPAGPALRVHSFFHSAGRGLITQVRVREDHTYVVSFNEAGGNGDGDEGSSPYASGGFGAVPASDEAIAGLEEAAVGETRETKCAVCLDGFEALGDKIRKMPCSHGFHESCIFEWLRISRLCRLCRFPISAVNDYHS